jgi:N-formylglutamate deformylase
MNAFTVTARAAPLLVSFPHAGTGIPPDIEARLTPAALARPDTDWHLPRLYDFCEALGATTLVPHWSRYVIDLNRPPEDANLYPGQDTTGLVPVDTFRKEPLYQDGQAPDAAEIAARRVAYWQPYHDALAVELSRLRARHAAVLLWDAHSIASVLPRFFDGKLPDFNLGSADGKAAGAPVQAAAEAALRELRGFTWVSNGRFKGGYITRRYGEPARGVHALQMEICQCIYMDEAPPFAFDEVLARSVRPVLRAMLERAVAALPSAR